MKHILRSKIFISAIIAVAVIAVGTIIALNVNHSGNDLQTQLDLGQKYTSELDYENAIVAYEKALEIDPYCLDAYLGLADAYSALGQSDNAVKIMEQAKSMLPDSVELYEKLALMYAAQNQMDLVVSTLEEGIQVTDSDRLREMLREYQPDTVQVEAGTVSNAAEEEEEVETEGQDTEENADIEEIPHGVLLQEEVPVLTITQTGEEPVEIPIVAPLTPTVIDYYESESGDNANDSNSSGSSDGNDSGSGSNSDNTSDLPSVIEGIAGNIYGTDGRGISEVTVTVYPESGDDPIIATTDTIGAYIQSIPIGEYRVVLSKEGYVDLDTKTTVWSSTLTNCNYVMLTTQERQQLATVQGVVISATDAQGVEGVTVTLLNGFDAYESQGISGGDKHTTTGSDGEFLIGDVHADYYTVAASKDGYSTYTHNETIKPGQNELTINMSPTIQSKGEYRIVLSWGENPRDLDSHLMCTGNDNYHVYFGDKNSSDGSASLDWDDTSSYGPETITVIIGDGNSYTYAVHNFTDRNAVSGEDRAWNLAQSDAKVAVYGESGIIFEGNVPTNAQGTTWEVFRIENGQLQVTNHVSFDHPTVLAASEDDGIMPLSDDGDDTLTIPEVTDEVMESNMVQEDIEATDEATENKDLIEDELETEETAEAEDELGTETVAETEDEPEIEEAAGAEDELETENAAETEEEPEIEDAAEAEEVEGDENTAGSEEDTGDDKIAEPEERLKPEAGIELEEPTEIEEDTESQASGNTAESEEKIN